MAKFVRCKKQNYLRFDFYIKDYDLITKLEHILKMKITRNSKN